MKTPFTGPNAMRCIRIFLIATCIIAVTPRLFGDIILLSRLSDADAFAEAGGYVGAPPPQSQTGVLPANLRNLAEAFHAFGGPYARANSTSNSSILINNAAEGLRVVGDGTATADVYYGGDAHASAKLIVLSFALTEVAYPYSITGQLNGVSCEQPSLCSMATAKLTGDTGTIFEKVGTALSESGTLLPGSYTLSVDVYASTQDVPGYHSDANFTFALNGLVSITRATNLSTRLLAGTRGDGNHAGIGGFIITGSGPRHLLLRGLGPSLGGSITNVLSDPSLQVNGPTGSLILTNDNWRDTQEAEIIATGRAPSDDFESAIVADLAPGAYTAILAGNAGTTGVGLVEIWDLLPNPGSRPSRQARGPEPVEGLANISTRGNVGTGNEIMIAGFILDGSSDEEAIILRGLGPSLDVNEPLQDPKLELRNSQGALIASNDNWMDDPNQAAIIQGAGLAPPNDLESAIAATLMPGAYTALLSGVNDGTGIGLVEVYDLGQ